MRVRKWGLASLAACVFAAPARGNPATFDFAYEVSGDRRVAPLQVFDDGRQTYLQFRGGQPIPAVFGAGAAGEQLLPHGRQGEYAVLPGLGQAFALRIGAVTARVRYTGTSARREAALMPAASSAPSPGEWAAEARAAPVAVAAFEAAAPQFDAMPADRNMRRTLARWAQAAGWTFQPEHWAVDVDIPLAGTARFGGDFRAAVRGLLAATALGERPLQPCFYANHVLRVLPAAAACDRSRPAGGR